MPAISAKNYALTSAAASDLGLGGSLTEEQEEIANKLKQKKTGDASDLLNGNSPFMGWGGAGTRGMVGAAAGDLGLIPF